MHRFFEYHSSLIEDKIYLQNNNVHHLNVLRISEDEEFEVVIDGIVYLVKIESLDKSSTICNIISKRKGENESNIKINLYQGLPKSDKLELIIQKCVELGINSITPFTSSRTIVKWDKKKEAKKLTRYQDIAESAAKQSKRTYIPEIKESVNFNQLCDVVGERYTILSYEDYGQTLKETILENDTEEFNIIIGPEGGFSEEEVKKLKEKGAKIVNLGNRILRTETAAIALTTMIQYEAGDINNK